MIFREKDEIEIEISQYVQHFDKRFNFIGKHMSLFPCTLCDMFIMFAETLIRVRGDLVRKVRVDELLLSVMMEKPVISERQKGKIEHVCTSSGFCDVVVCTGETSGARCFFLLFDL